MINFMNGFRTNDSTNLQKVSLFLSAKEPISKVFIIKMTQSQFILSKKQNNVLKGIRYKRLKKFRRYKVQIKLGTFLVQKNMNFLMNIESLKLTVLSGTVGVSAEEETMQKNLETTSLHLLMHINQKMWDENLDSRQETERLMILMLPVTG